ncbi:MAG: hypothetical protein IJO29_07785 [Oscillospiraceae bacterium]|nr:hypothetical protein [Oscillospiraceae bacterium]
MAIFTNQATLSYNGNVLNSNIVTGNIVQVLSATKNAVSEDYSANDDVTYVISIVNTGASAYTGVTVSDNLGAYQVGGQTVFPLDYVEGSIQYYLNGVLQGDPTVSAQNGLVISGISVPANSSAILIYQASVNSYAPLGEEGSITNTAVITAAGLTEPISVSETVNARSEANLSIAKFISPETVAENGEITYTFVIQNLGSRAIVATDDVVIADTFSPILNNISVELDGVLLSEPADYTYNEETGVFATAAGRVTVPAATFIRDDETGVWSTTPGVATLVIRGTV